MPRPDSSNSTHSTKAELRSEFRSLRRDIGEEARQHHNQAINAALLEVATGRDAARISGYLAFDGEPDISAALTHLNRQGVEIYLPVIGAGAQRDQLSFRRWPATGGDARPGELRRNTLGIQEPVVGDTCAVTELDIIFMPLVAWDRIGGRLGMGAGYYDRALAGVASAGTPFRVGIAYDVQRAEALPMTGTDVALHAIVTESGLFTCTT